MKKIAIYSILLLVVFAVGSFLGLYLYDKYNEYQIEKQNEQAKIEFQNKIKENGMEKKKTYQKQNIT